MPRVMILGDVHGAFSRINELICRQRPEMIIQCGDFGYFPEEIRMESLSQRWVRPFDPAFAVKNVLSSGKRIPIYWCDGNHEHFPTLFSKWKEAGARIEPLEIGPEMYYMPRGSTLELPSGEKVCFLGGARSVDRPLRVTGQTWFPEEMLSPGVLDVLPDRADLVISHTAPWSFDMSNAVTGPVCDEWDMTPDTSRDVLEEVLRRLKPLRWYFAHFHISRKGQSQGCDWTALSDLGNQGPGRSWEWFSRNS